MFITRTFVDTDEFIAVFFPFNILFGFSASVLLLKIF